MKVKELSNTRQIEGLLSENKYLIEKNKVPKEHSHGTLRFLSSFLNWKILTGHYGGRYNKRIDHASRFHALIDYDIENLELIRYMFSAEDMEMLRKHGGKLNTKTRSKVILKGGCIEELENRRIHVFTDCHYYEGIENVLISQLTDNMDVFLSAIQPKRGEDYAESTAEYVLSVEDDQILFQPEGSHGYKHRMSRLTD